MILLLQVAGLLAAGAVASALLFRTTRAAMVPTALVVLAVAFSYIAFWGHVWSLGRTFLDQHSNWSRQPPGQAEVAGTPAGVQSPFAEWLRTRIKPGERFYFIPMQDVGAYQWFTYRLMPNLAVDKPAKADVVIFYGTTPKKNGYRPSSFAKLEQYAPSFSIGRVANAS
jgi:hypothetical protein